jgi:hypothetical protein
MRSLRSLEKYFRKKSGVLETRNIRNFINISGISRNFKNFSIFLKISRIIAILKKYEDF